MTVNRTTLLDLPLPVTGTESGTWGDTTNNGLTQYLDIAIAGTLVLSTDADVTLTSTEGDSSATNIGATTAQYAILRWTATGSTTRNITALAQSKTYVVINATGGTQSIVLRGAGPTTGVTIISGEKAHCVWNGSDFVKVSSSAAAGGSNTQVQYNSSGVLAGSSNLTFDGTSLTLGGNPTLSGGTANGVLYLNGSKVATSGSALTFDGTTLGTQNITPNTSVTYSLGAAAKRWLSVYAGELIDGTDQLVGSASTTARFGFGASWTALGFGISGSEAMRLTSTGLGIGTSSPAYKLDVDATSSANAIQANSNNSTYGVSINLTYNGTAIGQIGSSKGIDSTGNLTDLAFNSAANLDFATGYTRRMRLDSSGNLGLGVTPSAWGAFKAFDLFSSLGASLASTGGSMQLGINFYYNGTNYVYKDTGHATRYEQLGGGAGTTSHAWFTAPSGTAGNAISFTQAMTLDASGNLLVGGTSNSLNARLIAENASGNQVGIRYSGIATYYLNATSGGDLAINKDGTERARITSGGLVQVSSGGSVQIGDTAARATTAGTNRLDIFNGTAPVGTLSNGISIYSSSGEAYVMDAAGNATLFSPHDAETNKWIFKSKHTPTGKTLKIDVEKLLRFINDHFGLDAVHEFIEP